MVHHRIDIWSYSKRQCQGRSYERGPVLRTWVIAKLRVRVYLSSVICSRAGFVLPGQRWLQAKVPALPQILSTSSVAYHFPIISNHNNQRQPLVFYLLRLHYNP
jgi:hypothetical protein